MTLIRQHLYHQTSLTLWVSLILRSSVFHLYFHQKYVVFLTTSPINVTTMIIINWFPFIFVSVVCFSAMWLQLQSLRLSLGIICISVKGFNLSVFHRPAFGGKQATEPGLSEDASLMCGDGGFAYLLLGMQFYQLLTKQTVCTAPWDDKYNENAEDMVNLPERPLCMWFPCQTADR